MKRQIVQIDQEKCNGCGQCIPNCVEGALKIANGKARLVSDKCCNGLGACLGHCPQDAIRIIEREADGYDENVTANPARAIHPTTFNDEMLRGTSELSRQSYACPGSQIRQQKPAQQTANSVTVNSQLSHWPIQLHLVPVNAPFFNGADLLITASCVPFSYGGFHNTLLAGRSLIVACPKLDRTEPYLEKLTEIFRQNSIKSVTVAIMEVPCCQGLLRLVRQALKDSGKWMSITVETITVKGEKL
ncbi:4Fe-4S binding protein [candidate division TA06 bacterium]|uniref:4Fe-4S binding protein n=1 Tax=candidate division TA06 bacterium TaxID=2250710 RepID=A0A933MKV2_UNCT6|nr:4Fe-4S binding protein [candidate division TA06 bacterium]